MRGEYLSLLSAPDSGRETAAVAGHREAGRPLGVRTGELGLPGQVPQVPGGGVSLAPADGQLERVNCRGAKRVSGPDRRADRDVGPHAGVQLLA